MKAFFSLLFSVILSGICLQAKAQDGLPPGEIKELYFHQELNLNEDKTLLVESEGKTSSSRESTSNNKTSVSSKPKSESSKNSGDKDSKEALNSNFLYLIIQKFKISDILD